MMHEMKHDAENKAVSRDVVVCVCVKAQSKTSESNTKANGNRGFLTECCDARCLERRLGSNRS
jgi:hypothetical protein